MILAATPPLRRCTSILLNGFGTKEGCDHNHLITVWVGPAGQPRRFGAKEECGSCEGCRRSENGSGLRCRPAGASTSPTPRGGFGVRDSLGRFGCRLRAGLLTASNRNPVAQPPARARTPRCPFARLGPQFGQLGTGWG